MTILLGELHPSLAIDLANAIDEDMVVATQYISSFLLYKIKIKNKRVKIKYIKDFLKQRGDCYFDNDDSVVRNVSEYYRAQYKALGVHCDPKPYVSGVLEQVSELFNEFDFKSIIQWNASSAINAATHELALKNNININILENGFFRPNTLTLDYRGLNFKSAYAKENARIKKLNKIKLNEGFNSTCSVKSNFYRCIDFIPIWPLNNAFFSIQHQLAKKQCKKANSTIVDLENITYVFLPLQLLEDSQSIFYSSYDNHSDVIKDALSLVNDSKCFLVVKYHPLDLNRTDALKCLSRYEKSRVIFSDNPTDDLIDGCERVITVNSTVGIESLLKNKEVHLLGRAMYEGLTNVNGNKCGDDISDFRRKTQVDFNINDYDVNDLLNLVGYMK